MPVLDTRMTDAFSKGMREMSVGLLGDTVGGVFGDVVFGGGGGEGMVDPGLGGPLGVGGKAGVGVIGAVFRKVDDIAIRRGKDFTKRMKDIFGITDDANMAGFISDDGSMLNLNRHKEGRFPYAIKKEDDFLHHFEAAEIGAGSKGSKEAMKIAMDDAGMVRFDTSLGFDRNRAIVNSTVRPTSAQVRRIVKELTGASEVILDVPSGVHRFEFPTAGQLRKVFE